jgi:hypothetical protein
MIPFLETAVNLHKIFNPSFLGLEVWGSAARRR